MPAFQQPNRTKSFFAQVDQGRPEAAQQKLGGIMGSQSSLQNQAAAQTGENQKVDASKTQIANSVSTGYGNLGETSKLGTHVANQQSFVTGNTPVLKSNVAPTDMTATNKEDKLTRDSLQTDVVNRDIVNNYATRGAALAGINTQAATKELGDAYQRDSNIVNNARKDVTENHFGQLGGPSAYEIQQAQVAQTLADRDSNIGKLKALYGSGYDSTKYGALDSNLLQGQFNDAQGQAQQDIAGLNTANKNGDRARSLYLTQMDSSKLGLDKNNTEAQANLTKLGGQISDLDIKIQEATGSARERLEKARVSLSQERDRIATAGKTYKTNEKARMDKIELDARTQQTDRARTQIEANVRRNPFSAGQEAPSAETLMKRQQSQTEAKDKAYVDATKKAYYAPKDNRAGGKR